MSERRFPWRVLLFVSLAVNLLTLGAIAGALGAGARLQRQDAPETVVMRVSGVRAFHAAVPPESRPELRRALGESWRATRDLRRTSAQARRDAVSAVSADPYDAERVRAAFARMRAADEAVVGVFHDNMAEFLTQLSPEQRGEVLQRLQRTSAEPREDAAPILEGVDAPVRERALTPEQRETLRERIRERREERRQQGQ